MSLVRRTVVGLALTSLTAGALAATVPGQAVAAGGASCHEQHYIPQYKSSAKPVKAPLITQIGARTIPPGGSRSVTFEVENVKNITAGAVVGGSVNTKIGNKLIGQAEVSLHTELSASGSKTNTTKTTVVETIQNRSGRNKKYVGFRGTIKVGSGVMQSYCSTPGSGPNGTVKWRKVGTWKTFTFVDEGVAQCGAGSTGMVPREALRVGCQ